MRGAVATASGHLAEGRRPLPPTSGDLPGRGGRSHPLSRVPHRPPEESWCDSSSHRRVSPSLSAALSLRARLEARSPTTWGGAASCPRPFSALHWQAQAGGVQLRGLGLEAEGLTGHGVGRARHSRRLALDKCVAVHRGHRQTRLRASAEGGLRGAGRGSLAPGPHCSRRCSRREGGGRARSPLSLPSAPEPPTAWRALVHRSLAPSSSSGFAAQAP